MLREIFEKHDGRLIHKVDHYIDIYEKHLSKFLGTNVYVLEIGVDQGGSLQMWKKYFGNKARIYGIDRNPTCKEVEEDRIKVFIGNQEDRIFLQSVIKAIPELDIVIDDGGHKMNQQIVSFEELFPVISENGIYICEDLDTSYKRKWGGKLGRNGTFIEYSKKLIDSLNTGNIAIQGMYFYRWLLIIEKGIINKPEKIRVGG